MSQLFASSGQRIRVSASVSVFPMNIQDWFPFGWTGWISLHPRDSQESSPTPQFKSIISLAISFLFGPTPTSIGEGSVNLLQYSCLENPRDRGARWAAVYEVADGRIWLKQLSSSSSPHAYMTTGRTIALTRWTFVGKVMSLLFNMLYRLVVAFLPREPHDQYEKGKLRGAEILLTLRMGICQTPWP